MVFLNEEKRKGNERQTTNQTLSANYQTTKRKTIMPRPNNNQTESQSQVTRSSSELTPQEFIDMLQEGGSREHLAKLMPEFFWQQAEQGASHFIIPTQMIKDRFLNIVLEQAVTVSPQVEDEDGVSSVGVVSTKFRLSAVVDRTSFQFILLSKDNKAKTNLKPGEKVPWLTGFRSLSLDLGDDVVEAGLLTQKEIGYLHTHAEFYQEVGNENYSKDKEYTNIRPYLTNVDGKEGNFLFLCDVRMRPLSGDEKIKIAAASINPATGLPYEESDFDKERESIGIILKGWTPGAFKLIGKASDTVSIDSRSGGSIEAPSKVSSGNWVYKRP